MLKITDLSLGFSGPGSVIANASLDLAEGQRIVICGAAGSGKSTLLATATGVVPRLVSIPYFSGQVGLFGQPVSHYRNEDLFGLTGLVTQNVEDQLWDLSVEDLIAFSMENRGLARRDIRDRIEELTDTLRLSQILGRRVLSLSGGERRMASIAAALAPNPRLLVLDEPTTGLDPAARGRLADVLTASTDSVGAMLVAEQNPTALRALTTGIAMLGNRQLSDVQPVDAAFGARDVWIRSGLIPPDQPPGRPRPSMQGKPLLEVTNLASTLVRADGRMVLQDVDLTICAGEIIGLIGHNGAGKSTLFKAILGLTKVASGTVVIDGQNATAWTPARRARQIAYVPQNMRHVLFNLSVLEEVTFSITASTARAQPEVKSAAMTILARYGLAPLAEESPFALSARQQTLLGLACAEASQAPLAILDEPLLGRDLEGRRLLDIFLRHMQDSGRAVMLISHDLELVDDVATRLMILDQGGMRFDGAVRDGWRRPAFDRLGWLRPYAFEQSAVMA